MAVTAALALAGLGCGTSAENCCTGGSEPAPVRPRLEEQLYDSGFAGAYERIRTLNSMRMQVAADADSPLLGSGEHEFILTGPMGAGVNVEDIFIGYLNGTQIYWKRGWGSIFGDVSFRFRGNEGDVLRVVSLTEKTVTNHCAYTAPIALYSRTVSAETEIGSDVGFPRVCPWPHLGDYEYYSKEFTLRVVEGKVRIEGLHPDPGSFEPQASPGSGVNTTTQITANVIKTEMPDATGNYTLTIMPKTEAATASKLVMQASDANPIDPPPFPSPPGPMVRKFTGNLNFIGDIATVNETWDGKSDSGSYFPEGECTVELSVTVTEEGGGEPRFAQAVTPVTVGGGPILEVVNGERMVLASTADDTHRGEIYREFEPRSLLVRIRNGPSTANVLRVSVGLDPPNPGSSGNLTLELHKSSTNNTTFESSFFIPDRVQAAPPRSVTICSGIPDLSLAADSYNILREQGFVLYGNATMPADPDNEDKNEVKFDRVSFAAAGTTRVRLAPIALSKSRSTFFRIENQASVLIENGHGEPVTGLLSSESGELLVTPRGVSLELTNAGGYKRLQMLILASCSVLRIHNYDGRGPLDPNERSEYTGGWAWNAEVQATSPSHPVLLGYNSEPTKIHAKHATAAFFRRGAGSPSEWPLNWILANSAPEVLQQDVQRGVSPAADADGACALAYNQDYWFVKSDNQWLGQTGFRTLWRVHRTVGHVAKSRWSNLSTANTSADPITWSLRLGDAR